MIILVIIVGKKEEEKERIYKQQKYKMKKRGVVYKSGDGRGLSINKDSQNEIKDKGKGKKEENKLQNEKRSLCQRKNKGGKSYRGAIGQLVRKIGGGRSNKDTKKAWAPGPKKQKNER